ncbi:hypothetical protein MBLNU459_g4804t1 [Dothideomycetes sp. NU459]
MPRDLAEMRDAVLNGMPDLEKSSKTLDPPRSSASESASSGHKSKDKEDRLDEIKPYTKALTVSDVDSCVKLEDATFPPQERCTKEKFIYRFSKCGELSLGLFTSANTSEKSSGVASAPTASTANPVYSGAPDRKLVLLAHCVVTKTTNPTIHDEDMALPPDWNATTTSHVPSDPKLGHKDDGRTICIHSLAVLPEYQGEGLGSMLMKAFVQRIEGSGTADRIALLAHDSFVAFYEKFGFENKGPSKATFGGGDWVDMVHELK